MKYIRLPLIRTWTYESRPENSRPVLAKTGIVVNLDLIPSMYELEEHNTMVGQHQIPLSLEAIVKQWTQSAVPLDRLPLEPIPYHPSWAEKYNLKVE